MIIIQAILLGDSRTRTGLFAGTAYRFVVIVQNYTDLIHETYLLFVIASEVCIVGIRNGGTDYCCIDFWKESENVL